MAAPLNARAADTTQWETNAERDSAQREQRARDQLLCDKGKRQSPIDIVETRKQNLPAIVFRYRAAPLRLVNDGHTVRVRFANGSEFQLGKERFALQQAHFHAPGGDKVRGEAFPLAAHLLHKGSDGRLTVIVVLFRLGGGNTAFDKLLEKIPARTAGEQTLADNSVNVAEFLPAAHGYYAYDGSLTGPPCTEGVRWMVLKQPLEVSAGQLARYRSLFRDNARAVQPLHGREVQESL